MNKAIRGVWEKTKAVVRNVRGAASPLSIWGALPDHNGYARVTGTCGDTMEVWLKVERDRVVRASFDTDGCGSTVTCGQKAVEQVLGRSLSEAAMLDGQAVKDAVREEWKTFPEESDHCAELAASTMREACADYQRRAPKTDAADDCSADCASCEKAEECSSAPASPEGQARERALEQQRLERQVGRIRRKWVVLSGKGGVGKSTVAVNLAAALALSGKRVGLLDADIHGPSIPTMLGLKDAAPEASQDGLFPIHAGGLLVMSVGFFLKRTEDAVIWRGPMKAAFLKQLLADVHWGDLDALVVDLPPGTGDEPLSIFQMLGPIDGAVIVTTPQKIAAIDVRKSVTFCAQMKVPVVGVIENMSGFVCPKCGEVTQVFAGGAGQQIAADMHVPYLGSLPLDPAVAVSGDQGSAFVSKFSGTRTAELIKTIFRPILGLTEEGVSPILQGKENDNMKIAIPFADGLLSTHFGHCEQFALLDVDTKAKKILKRKDVEAPPHEPGLLPRWLAGQKVQMVIAGGMGQRARDLFAEQGITVVVGASAETPERLVLDYMAGTLKTGANACDH